MSDEWMPTIKLAMSREEFRQLPRNAAYRYDFLDGEALLSPRPKHYHAVLDLQRGPAAAEIGSLAAAATLRPVEAGDWPTLERLFVDAFRTTQPFGSVDEEGLSMAAAEALARTRHRGDGPLIEAASFVAVQAKQVIAAALVTLIPHGDPCASESYRWHEPPPEDCIARRLGRPHLTWIFVTPLLADRGVGSALLAACTRALRTLGFEQLLSTFVLGNDSSMLWHWRHGFELLAYPTSHLRRQQRRPS
jgi:GNAT superfamily N-acetyltransferase